MTIQNSNRIPEGRFADRKDLGIRVDDGIADPCLRCQIHYDSRLVQGEDAVNASLQGMERLGKNERGANNSAPEQGAQIASCISNRMLDSMIPRYNKHIKSRATPLFNAVSTRTATTPCRQTLFCSKICNGFL